MILYTDIVFRLVDLIFLGTAVEKTPVPFSYPADGNALNVIIKQILNYDYHTNLEND